VPLTAGPLGQVQVGRLEVAAHGGVRGGRYAGADQFGEQSGGSGFAAVHMDVQAVAPSRCVVDPEVAQHAHQALVVGAADPVRAPPEGGRQLVGPVAGHGLTRVDEHDPVGQPAQQGVQFDPARGSRPAAGSSSSSTAGWWINARARLSRCF